jgi:hypothetical protein
MLIKKEKIVFLMIPISCESDDSQNNKEGTPTSQRF